MSYNVWSVVFGEQPSASKWNILGANDASFNDGTGFASGIILPKHLVAGLASSWAWQSWTPTWANLTVGNGTVEAKYVQIGKTIIFRVAFVLGSTSAIGTSPTFTLPATAVTIPSGGTNIADFGEAVLSDGGSAQYRGVIKWSTTGIGVIQYEDDAGAGVREDLGVTATTPMTWVTGDAIYLMGRYEAA